MAPAALSPRHARRGWRLWQPVALCGTTRQMERIKQQQHYKMKKSFEPKAASCQVPGGVRVRVEEAVEEALPQRAVIGVCEIRRLRE